MTKTHTIEIRTVFDSHDKNAEVMIVVRSAIDYSKPLEPQYNAKCIYGGNFIVGPAKDYNDAVVKTKDIVDKLQAKVKVWNSDTTDILHLISILKSEMKTYRKATE